MKRVIMVAGIIAATLNLPATAQSPGPTAIASINPIAPPRDIAYPGDIQLSVDTTDLGRRIVRVHERLSGVRPDTVLLYPKWLPGAHAPEGPIDRVAGFTITANGAPVEWTRDPVDVYAFRVHAARGVSVLDIDFEYLSSPNRDVGPSEMSPNLLIIDWNNLVLYPAGYFSRRIPVEVTLTLPAGWQFGSALEADHSAGATTVFKRVMFNTLVDSPVYAGRYAARFDLDPGGPAPVHLDLFADRAELLEAKPEYIQAYRALVRQAYKLFASHHYAHYDFLYSLSDQVEQQGLEHHQSSEDGTDPDSFTEWDHNASDRDLLCHEFTHSWNGKFRRPADLWTPNFNVPMQDSLLWVYEGLTQYWGDVLAGRAGLRTRQQSLDELAGVAAYYQIEPGQQWRALQDTTNDEIINPRRPMPWRNWQRFEDYYKEGELIWLDVDTLIREHSSGRRSLDDLARAFFGMNDGSFVTLTYTFNDLVKALNAVEPFDWAAFLRERLDSVNHSAPLGGLTRGGYRLVYNDTESEYQKTTEEHSHQLDLLHSIGLRIGEKDGGDSANIAEVLWGGPAYQAKLTLGGQILAVNGVAYSPDVLKDAIRSARSTNVPIELIVKNGATFTVAHVDYHGGPRYSHLERDSSQPARLDEILSPRP
jgi:predicted metalloprotease with PDZ domain